MITRCAVVAGAVLIAVLFCGTSSAETVHTIRSGETLSGIAKQYGVSVTAIVRTNELRSPKVRLRPGTKLTIPAGDDTAVRARPTDRPRGGRRGAASRTPARPSATPASLRLTIPEIADPVPPFSWPVEGGISSNFGRRRRGWHKGVDIVAAPGTPIIASAAGLVITSSVEARYGRVVKIAHDNGFVTVYAHNTMNAVDLGEWVSAGQVIGTVGRTGRATAEHLHFEIRHEGYAYNPLYLLPLPPRMMQVEEMEPDEDDDHD